MRYAAVINKIQNHLENESSPIVVQKLKNIVRELRYESRYEAMATEKYYLTMINHAMLLMKIEPSA